MEGLLDPQIVDGALRLLERYGYLFLVLGTLLQGVGLPLPAQTILVTAGVLIGQDLLEPLPTVAFGMAGALTGSQLGYAAGRRGGRPSVLRWGRLLGLTAGRLDRAEKYFRGREKGAILAARFVPVLKTFGYLAAGVSRTPYTVFIRYDLLGTLLWVVASLLVGYLASESVMALVER